MYIVGTLLHLLELEGLLAPSHQTGRSVFVMAVKSPGRDSDDSG